MKLDFRLEYRIVEHKRQDCEYTYYEIETRAWWWPFWVVLDGALLFSITELCKYRFVYPDKRYETVEIAEARARDYAERGRMVFVTGPKVTPVKYLGKLP